MSNITGQGAAPRKRKLRKNSFTPTKRQKFLDALALTCNVRTSADHAGVDHTTVYYHRVRDAVFSEQWREALAMGYDRLEALVLEHGGAGEALDTPDADRAAADGADPRPFDFDRALKVLQQYRGTRAGQSRLRDGRCLPNASREETTAAIMKALAAMERRVARTGGRDA